MFPDALNFQQKHNNRPSHLHIKKSVFNDKYFYVSLESTDGL